METERNEIVLYPEDMDKLPNWGWREHRFHLIGIYGEGELFMALPEIIPPQGWHNAGTFQFRDRVYMRITQDVMYPDAPPQAMRVYQAAQQQLNRNFAKYGPDTADELERQLMLQMYWAEPIAV